LLGNSITKKSRIKKKNKERFCWTKTIFRIIIHDVCNKKRRKERNFFFC